jgi:hypothetical protein
VTAEPDLRAVPRIPAPDLSACALFERGHHAHPVQVSLALKNVGDDGRFTSVALEDVRTDDVGGRTIVRVRLRRVSEPNRSDLPEESPLSDGSGLLDLVGHDPALALTLSAVEHPVFVWEEQYGVLFVMTEQGREVMGTGAVTLTDPEVLSVCVAGDA